MKYPKMREDWDSRFMGTDTRKIFAAFREDYVGNVQEEYSGRIESMRALKESKTIAVTSGKQQLAEALANVAASGVNNGEQIAQLTTILAQLVKTEADVAKANDRLGTLQTKKEAEEVGARDPENIDWLQNIKLKDNNDSTTAATFTKELRMKLDSISEAEWKKYTNGSFFNGKKYATAMSHLATYYDQKFSLAQFG